MQCQAKYPHTENRDAVIPKKRVSGHPSSFLPLRPPSQQCPVGGEAPELLAIPPHEVIESQSDNAFGEGGHGRYPIYPLQVRNDKPVGLVAVMMKLPSLLSSGAMSISAMALEGRLQQ